MKRIRRNLTLSLAAVMLISVCSGCSGSSVSSQTAGSGSSVSSNETVSSADAASGITFPLAEQQTLKVWMPVPNAELTSQYTDFSDLPRYQEIEKRLNLKIELICPTVGSEKDSFNLMVAGGSLPDILDGTSINYYSGGAEKAYSDGIIIRLNDLQEQYAPDLTEIYNTYADVSALCKNDAGDYLYTPFIRGASWLTTFNGPIVRKDWLEELGLSEPETISDWYDMLTVFKNEKGASAPLLLSYNSARNDGAFSNGFLIGAYGITVGYSVEDGKVIYGAADSRYRDFLTEMAKWYSEGLIDPEIGSNSSQTYNAKAQSDKTGAFNANSGSGIGTYLKAMATVDPDYELEGVVYPSLKEGETCKFYQHGKSLVAAEACITSSCKNPELAMAYLNYGYSDDGYILYNYGIEGESFTWEDGTPVLTDLILNNPDGLTAGAASQQYAFVSAHGNLVQDPRWQLQYLTMQEQKDAIQSWSKASDQMTPETGYDCYGILTSDETTQISSMETQINSYRDEMLLKFITGVEPINDDTWNQYVSQLDSLGLQDCLKARQTAEDRFKAGNPDFYKAASFSTPSDFYKDVTQSISSK